MMPWIWLVVAYMLLFLEFYLPGGIMAIGAVVFFIASIVHAALLYEISTVVLFFVASLIGVGFVIRLSLSRVKKSSDTIFLNSDQEGFEGVEKKSTHIGKEGVALSDLSPSGVVRIEGSREQVVCQEGYVEKGSTVVVVDSRGGYLVVRPKGGEK